MSKSSLGIKNVRIIDPYNAIDNISDIIIVNGIITNIGKDLFSQSEKNNIHIIDGTD